MAVAHPLVSALPYCDGDHAGDGPFYLYVIWAGLVVMDRSLGVILVWALIVMSVLLRRRVRAERAAERERDR